MKDALNDDNARVEASPDAPQVATCPACGGVVDLRSRRNERGSDEKRTWYCRHRRGEGPRCSRRSGPGW